MKEKDASFKETIEKYTIFIADDNLYIQFKDSNGEKIIIDFEKINVESLAINAQDNKFVVSILTTESLNKFKLEVTETIECPGLFFDEHLNAAKMISVLSKILFTPLISQESVNESDSK
jgi:hypothetical protein